MTNYVPLCNKNVCPPEIMFAYSKGRIVGTKNNPDPICLRNEESSGPPRFYATTSDGSVWLHTVGRPADQKS